MAEESNEKTMAASQKAKEAKALTEQERAEIQNKISAHEDKIVELMKD